MKNLQEFITEYKWLTEFFAIDFLTTDFYDRMPNDWKVLETVELSELFEIVSMGKVREEWPFSLQEFIKKAHFLPINRSCYLKPTQILKDICLGMNEKKVTETSLISQVIDQVCQETNSTHIIDFGCGQGYLSTVLAYQFGYHVIGIDSDPKQVIGGRKRSDRISHLLQIHGHDIQGSLRFISKRVEWKDGLDSILDLIEFEYPELVGKKWIVCGLHTCGDLATTMIKGMVQSKKLDIQGLISIGCCYQRLTEYSDTTTRAEIGFPLSESLYPYQLGLVARVVGCSASQRWQPDSIEVQESLRRLYYRAVLEKLFQDEQIPKNERNIKKMGKMACIDPITYTKSALERLKCEKVIPDETILDAFERYSYAKKPIAILWALRALLGDPIESLILLDRLEYVQEQGFMGTLISVVDPQDSPRNMALVVKRS